MEHTKGKWKYDGINGSVYTQDDKTWKEIAYIRDCSNHAENPLISEEEARANAQLIAASPELLKACKKTLKMIKGRFPLEHGRDDIGEAWGALENAIAKAEGK